MNISKKAVYIVSGITGTLFVGLVTMCIVLVSTGDKSFLEEKKLDPVKDVIYNPGNSTLFWDKVENATSYKVSINGQELETKETSFKFLPNQKNITYAIQALDETNAYKDSDWSTPFRFTFNNTDVNYARMNVFAKDIVHSEYNFDKLLAMDIDGKNLNAIILASKDNVKYVSEYQVTYPKDIPEFKALLKEKLPESSLKNIYPATNYNGMDELLKSEDYKGMFADIENVINEGYQLSVVSQASVKNSDESIVIHSILKAKKDIDIRYIRNDVEVTYNNKISTEEEMFTTRLRDPKKRNLRCLKGEILSFDEYDLAASIDLFNSK